jgi:hypothetical protein
LSLPRVLSNYSDNRTLRSYLTCSSGIGTGIDLIIEPVADPDTCPAVDIIYREYSGILLDNST